MTRAVNGWRPPTFYEQSILDLLLQTQFEGVEAIRTQLTDFEVRTISGFGSIAIRSKSTVHAKVNHRVPVEAYALDIDGNAIHYLLHVVAGVANELEVYTDTTDCPLSKPSPQSLTIKITT